ncbi:hypothetical protein D3Z60_02750 [Lachnospiraceae bacterium]|nr:hypothetical protein [Lachnospiraceae bacterium]
MDCYAIGLEKFPHNSKKHLTKRFLNDENGYCGFKYLLSVFGGQEMTKLCIDAMRGRCYNP